MDSVRYSTLLVAVIAIFSITYSQAKVQCVACRGNINSKCHLRPEQEQIILPCDKCAVFGRIYKTDGTLFEIVRDCAHRTFPVPVPARFENKCKDDNAHFIECTHTCTSGDLCSNSLSYTPPGWNEDGSKVGSRGGNPNSGDQKNYSLVLILATALITVLVHLF